MKPTGPRKNKRSISFIDPTSGKKTASVRITETGGMGNKHFTVTGRTPLCGEPLRRNADGKAVSFCGQPWKPVCPNPECQGNIVPRRMMTLEKYGRVRTATTIERRARP